ncbi:MAG: aminotransferase class V-fold PLP-dependent enzyme [Bacteroidetes bacterium]|nr:aminotransferase class V-fold PLP-dependent enzyme [Bacteroidota bacterium]
MMDRSDLLRLQEAYDPVAFRRKGHALVDLLADHLENSFQQQRPDVFPPHSYKEQLEFWEGFLESGDPDQFYEQLLERSIRLHHPHYMGHQVSVPAPMAVLTGLMSDMLNNGMAVFEMGPAATAVERMVLQTYAKAVGWMEDADGILTSGGTLANLTALLTARSVVAPDQSWDHKTTDKLTLMVSEEAHYCIDRAVRIMGWGAEGIIKIPVDAQFQMRTDLLEEKLKEAQVAGKKVVAVIGSACSTATGSFDNLQAIGAFCRKHELWFHVDAAHGGAGILAERHKKMLNGIELADSLIVDFHKMAAAPALVTGVLYREGRHGFRTFAQQADYLYTEAGEDWHNTGKRTFECTKTMMGAKVYALLKFHGTEFIESYVNRCYALGSEFAKMIKSREGMELLTEPSCNIVVFRYLAGSEEDCNRINRDIRTRLMEDRRFYVVSTVRDGKFYLRCTFTNPFTAAADLEALLQLMESFKTP